MLDRSTRARRAIALAAAVAGGVTDLGYLRQISDQGTAIDARIAFVAGFIALAAALAAVGAATIGRDDRLAQLVLLASLTAFFGLGFIALFSIGTALLFAGVLAAIADGRRPVPGRAAAGIVLGTLAVLAAGIALTTSVARAV